jgi:ribosome-associated protein
MPARAPGDLVVNARWTIPAAELEVQAARSGGPGGQAVNKLATKVVLRFALAHSASLPTELRAHVLRELAARLDTSGALVIHASEHRERSRNLDAARARLARLLALAAVPPRVRRATRPTRGSQQRRLAAKRQLGDKKQRRQTGHASCEE